MQQYLNLLNRILTEGATKTDRTGTTMTLDAILDGIRTGKWAALVKPVRKAVEAGNEAAKDAAKGRLPGFTPGGRFTARKKDGLAVVKPNPGNRALKVADAGS